MRGAEHIEVLTDGGGRRLIRITDDGAGMSGRLILRSRLSAMPHRNCRKTICSISVRSASAARHCRQSAPWRN